MQTLSFSGQQAIQDLAQRSGFSTEAVTHMLDSVAQGHGSMAQFNHFEFGGSGQWMQGGMTMLSDMFNNVLKGRVDGLCSELSRLLAQQTDLWQSSPLPSQNAANWWGNDLCWPNSTGSQNGTRYAYFAQARRLAIDIQGQVTVYDTLDHQIGGFSQQQSGNSSFGFSSQYGWVDVNSLPVVSINGITPQAAAVPPTMPAPAPLAVNNPVMPPTPGNATEGDIFFALERLAALHGKGILTDQEYSSKKAELLARI